MKTAAECGGVEGYYAGDGSSCSLEENVCPSLCGDGCVTYGEQCDDGNTGNLDGCDEKCQTETCYSCYESVPSFSRTVIVVPGCVGPSICSFDVENPQCTTCGNGEVEPGEDCDPGEGFDPCCDDCSFASAGTACDDGVFCNGVEQCDGEGTCSFAEVGPDCSNLDSECSEGVCDPEEDSCVALPIEGPCTDIGDCAVEGSGQCVDGVCVGAGTTLSPTCRWIVVGANPSGDPVRVRTGRGSVLDANTCSETARLAGISQDSHVVTATTGEGVRFYGPPEVAGDIATGGASVGSNLYLTVPGTSLKTVASGTTVAKTPFGIVDTTGAHELVSVCADDKIALGLAKTTLDTKASTATAGGPNGLKVPHGAAASIDVTGDGVAVVDLQGLKVGHGATLTLRGNATDVLMIRIAGGRLKIGYGAKVMLDGLVPQNVLFYADGSRCRVSPGVTGAGTIYCPEAGRFVIGVGTEWSGTFLGAARELQVRLGADLTHVPFTGF